MAIIIHKDSIKKDAIGGKASNLVRLNKFGISVPQWCAIPAKVLLAQIPKDSGEDEKIKAFSTLKVSAEIRDEIRIFFGNDAPEKAYAVRSSALDEDGKEFSFAGQFDTYLNVPFNDISQTIIKCWQSAVSPRVRQYRKENGLPLEFGMGVIVQEMLQPDVSGVAFGIDPVSGDATKKIISAVYGVGEGLVSGALNADVYTLQNKDISSQLANKEHYFVKHPHGTGLQKINTPAEKLNAPALKDDQLFQIANVLDRLQKELGHPQDIEFAYAEDKLYLLQTRPVTASAKEHQGEYILWDNSNIVESYPGITTPLTYSFIARMYEMVYRQFVSIMGVKSKELELHANVFKNTLGLVRGRVYYNLLSWYKMLAMLPGFALNSEYMETMMGVKERFELKEDLQMSKGLARIRIVGMAFNMMWKQIRLPAERRKFLKLLNATMQQYSAIDFSSLAADDIVKKYKQLENTLLLEWKAPLTNDFFSMIWFGMLQKQCTQHCPDEKNLHNDLLCGSQDIISVEPIYRCIEIASAISSSQELKETFLNLPANELWSKMQAGEFSNVHNLFIDYIKVFGDRCHGELKLETVSYSHDPALLVKLVQSYVRQGITHKKPVPEIENKLRDEASQKVLQALKGKAIKRRWFFYVLKKARDLVSNRENLRYERTRAFGLVRKMFMAIGDDLHKKAILKHPRDVFYMKLEEIEALTKSLPNADFAFEIETRKKEFDGYRNQEVPKERFYTYGMDFKDEYIYSSEKLEPVLGDLKGIGCCPGRVQGKVQKVLNPNDIDSLNGDILVTSSTDPGWVTLFPTASAIIVERGSLLSHSAIVSREMGIPCIVSVDGLLRSLETGDEVLMDGSSGEIKVVKKKDAE